MLSNATGFDRIYITCGYTDRRQDTEYTEDWYILPEARPTE